MKRPLLLVLAPLLMLLAACSEQPQRPLAAQSALPLTPNIQAYPASNLHLETQADGSVFLRFDTLTWNSGQGPLELVAGEIDSANARQKVYQRIYADDGSHSDTYVGTFVWHSEHDHFHFENYARYWIEDINNPSDAGRNGEKTTFCIMDTDIIDRHLPGAPKRAQYGSCSNMVQGMSVGWGDTYKAGLYGQWVDVTDLPAGEYRLEIWADPMGQLVESNDGDNKSEVFLRLDVQSGTVEAFDPSGGSGDDGGGRPGNCPRCN